MLFISFNVPSAAHSCLAEFCFRVCVSQWGQVVHGLISVVFICSGVYRNVTGRLVQRFTRECVLSVSDISQSMVHSHIFGARLASFTCISFHWITYARLFSLELVFHEGVGVNVVWSSRLCWSNACGDVALILCWLVRFRNQNVWAVTFPNRYVHSAFLCRFNFDLGNASCTFVTCECTSG